MIIIKIIPNTIKLNTSTDIVISIIDKNNKNDENNSQDDKLYNAPKDLPIKAKEYFMVGWNRGLEAEIRDTSLLVSMGWDEVNKHYKKIGDYWFEKPTSSLITANLKNVKFVNLNISSEGKQTKALKLIKVPVAHVGANKNGLYYKLEALENMKDTWNDIPVQGDYLMQSNDHTLSENEILSYGTVGWTSNSMFDGNTQYVDITVTEPRTIEKLLRKTPDGKRELNGVSMGAFTYDVCSICGEPFNNCEHQILNTYDNQICYRVPIDGYADHIAFTNKPADPNTYLDNVIEQII